MRNLDAIGHFVDFPQSSQGKCTRCVSDDLTQKRDAVRRFLQQHMPIQRACELVGISVDECGAIMTTPALPLLPRQPPKPPRAWEVTDNCLPPIMHIRELTAAKLLEYLDVIAGETQGGIVGLTQSLARYNLERAVYLDLIGRRTQLEKAARTNSPVWDGRGRLQFFQKTQRHQPTNGQKTDDSAPTLPRIPMETKVHGRNSHERHVIYVAIELLAAENRHKIKQACAAIGISVPRYYVYRRQFQGKKHTEEIQREAAALVQEHLCTQESAEAISVTLYRHNRSRDEQFAMYLAIGKLISIGHMRINTACAALGVQYCLYSQYREKFENVTPTAEILAAAAHLTEKYLLPQPPPERALEEETTSLISPAIKHALLVNTAVNLLRRKGRITLKEACALLGITYQKYHGHQGAAHGMQCDTAMTEQAIEHIAATLPPDVFAQYEEALRKPDTGTSSDDPYEPLDEAEANKEYIPTHAPIGSYAKLDVLAERVRKGLPLWHPEDTTGLVDLRGLRGLGDSL